MTTVSYEFIPIHETDDPLIALSSHDFILDFVYFHQGLSTARKMYLRKSVTEKLLKIQKKLQKCRFKIWDGFRSRDVQKNIYNKFWKELQQENSDWNEEKLASEVSIFVTKPDDPKRIPPHATGGAVDLTLVDEKGKELNMGTGFDHFGPEASPLYYDENGINDIIKNNRKLLRDAMFVEDFSNDNDEWWHFNYGNQTWAVQQKKEFAFFGEAHV